MFSGKFQKPERGDYAADQILYTAEAESYWPNDYGLYNMSGNVSEWTDSNYERGANDFVAGLNPNVEGSEKNNKKVVRGGSWKDVSHFLKVSTRDYEYQNKKTHNWIEQFLHLLLLLNLKLIQPLLESL